MNQQSYYTTNTTNTSCHPPHSFSSIKKTLVKAQYRANDSFHGVPHKLPSIIEIRRSRTKTPLSSSAFQVIMKCLRFCFVATISKLSKYLLCGSRISGNAQQLKVTHGDKEKNNSKQRLGEDDDENSHKHVFRQDMETFKCVICHGNCMSRCGDKFFRSNNVYRIYHHNHGNNTNTYSNSTIRHYRKQHYRMANQLIQQHFVHANYLNRQSHFNALCNE